MRPLAAECLGTGLLLFIIVGSGIAAETLVADPGTQLFAHAVSVGLGLGVAIALMQPASGAHFNPSVTLAFWRTATMPTGTAVRYVAAQLLGAVLGVAAANATFEQPVLAVSGTARGGLGLVGAEIVSTFVLVLLILALVRTGRSGAVPTAVGAWVAAIVFATSSTGFANPVVTLARTLTDSYAGIAPRSVAAFVIAQLLAGFAAAAVAIYLYPATDRQRADL